MLPLGKSGGVQVTDMEVEFVLTASIISGAEGAGGGGGRKTTKRERETEKAIQQSEIHEHIRG